MKKILYIILFYILIAALLIAGGKHVKSIENNPNGYNASGHAHSVKIK